MTSATSASTIAEADTSADHDMTSPAGDMECKAHGKKNCRACKKKKPELTEAMTEAGWDLELAEAADSMMKASTHKRGLETKKGKSDNWVERTGPGGKGGQLPAYIQHIALAIHRKRGVPKGTAIGYAIGAVKRWAKGAGGVDANTKAAAAKALGEWTALKAKSKGKAAKKAIMEAEGYAAALPLDTELLAECAAVLVLADGLALQEAAERGTKGKAKLDPKTTPPASTPKDVPTPSPAAAGVGERVMHLQRRLDSLGFDTLDDGKFGPKTAASVKTFQKHAMLKDDGIVGPLTTLALRAAPHGDEIKAAMAEEVASAPAKHEAAHPAKPDAGTKPGAPASGKPGGSDAPAHVAPKIPPTESVASVEDDEGTLYKGLGVGEEKPHQGTRILQDELEDALGYDVEADGRFGPKTESVVKRFQRKFGLRADGMVGPKTKRAISGVKAKTKQLAEAEALAEELGGRDRIAAMARRDLARRQLTEGFDVLMWAAAAIHPPEASISEAAAGMAKRGARQALLQLKRKPDGTFAPKGTGMVLRAGQKVEVPHKSKKGAFVKGTVQKGGKVKLDDGPDAGQSITVAGGGTPDAPQSPGTGKSYAKPNKKPYSGGSHVVLQNIGGGKWSAVGGANDEAKAKKLAGTFPGETKVVENEKGSEPHPGTYTSWGELIPTTDAKPDAPQSPGTGGELSQDHLNVLADALEAAAEGTQEMLADDAWDGSNPGQKADMFPVVEDMLNDVEDMRNGNPPSRTEDLAGLLKDHGYLDMGDEYPGLADAVKALGGPTKPKYTKGADTKTKADKSDAKAGKGMESGQKVSATVGDGSTKTGTVTKGGAPGEMVSVEWDDGSTAKVNQKDLTPDSGYDSTEDFDNPGSDDPSKDTYNADVAAEVKANQTKAAPAKGKYYFAKDGAELGDLAVGDSLTGSSGYKITRTEDGYEDWNGEPIVAPEGTKDLEDYVYQWADQNDLGLNPPGLMSPGTGSGGWGTGVEDSPGRGPTGKIRNMGAMKDEKLLGVIDDLVAHGADPEALEKAILTAQSRGLNVSHPDAQPGKSIDQAFPDAASAQPDDLMALASPAPASTPAASSGTKEGADWIGQEITDKTGAKAKITAHHPHASDPEKDKFTVSGPGGDQKVGYKALGDLLAGKKTLKAKAADAPADAATPPNIADFDVAPRKSALKDIPVGGHFVDDTGKLYTVKDSSGGKVTISGGHKDEVLSGDLTYKPATPKADTTPVTPAVPNADGSQTPAMNAAGQYVASEPHAGDGAGGTFDPTAPMGSGAAKKDLPTEAAPAMDWGPNSNALSLKDMPLGQQLEMNDGSQWTLHKPVNDPWMIMKPVGGGKAKPIHKMYSPPKIGPMTDGYQQEPPSFTPTVVPDAPPATDDLMAQLEKSVDTAATAKAAGQKPDFKAAAAQQAAAAPTPPAKDPGVAALDAYVAAGGSDPAVIAALTATLKQAA